MEAVLVLSGRVSFLLGDASHELEEGDSITYGARQAHNFSNLSRKDPVVLLWVCNERGAT